MSNENKKNGEEKQSILKIALNTIKKYAIMLSSIILCILGVAYTFYLMKLPYDVDENTFQKLLIFALIVTIIIFVMAIIIIVIINYEFNKLINNEALKSVDEKLECQKCMNQMLEIQKKIYNDDIGRFMDTISVNEIRKINLLISSLANDNKISNNELIKIQNFVDLLITTKENKEFSSYITLEDMKIIESRVENKSKIHIISSSISCDDDLKNTIINNLKRGVFYFYYFPKTENKDINFEELLNQFNNNLRVWQESSGITEDIIRTQIHCYCFPEEYMQMSMTFYDFQKSATGKNPTAIVKFPAVSEDIANEYPLFFYISSKSNLNLAFCRSLTLISSKSKECKLIKKNKRFEFVLNN